MTEVAFDDKKSLLHFLTGIATAQLGPAGSDFIEFILGILAGLLF